MGSQNIGARYQSISFDKQFIEMIKEHIVDKKQYRSIADFAREAIREKMERERKQEPSRAARLAAEDLNLIINAVVGTLEQGYKKIKKK